MPPKNAQSQPLAPRLIRNAHGTRVAKRIQCASCSQIKLIHTAASGKRLLCEECMNVTLERRANSNLTDQESKADLEPKDRLRCALCDEIFFVPQSTRNAWARTACPNCVQQGALGKYGHRKNFKKVGRSSAPPQK